MPSTPSNVLPWIRLDFCAHHPKLLQLVADGEWQAIALWHFALPWCGIAGTVGVVPAYALASLHGRQYDADKLVEVTLWEPLPGGWYVHDWDHYQPTGPGAEARRLKAQKAAQARWRKAQRKGADDA